MRGSAPQFQGRFGRDWLDIGDTANAISSEDLFLLHHFHN
jgi:hypothetical protein